MAHVVAVPTRAGDDSAQRAQSGMRACVLTSASPDRYAMAIWNGWVVWVGRSGPAPFGCEAYTVVMMSDEEGWGMGDWRRRLCEGHEGNNTREGDVESRCGRDSRPDTTSKTLQVARYTTVASHLSGTTQRDEQAVKARQPRQRGDQWNDSTRIRAKELLS